MARDRGAEESNTQGAAGAVFCFRLTDSEFCWRGPLGSKAGGYTFTNHNWFPGAEAS